MISATCKNTLGTEISINGYTLRTDVPKQMGGNGEFPNPFEMFLSSFLACTATSVFFYLKKHSISPEGIKLNLEPAMEGDRIKSAVITILLPSSFPSKSEEPLLAFAKHCKVGSHLNFPYEVKLQR